MASQCGRKKVNKSRPINEGVFYHAISDWLKKKKEILLHPNFQRLAKVSASEGYLVKEKVAFLNKVTFLLLRAIAKVSHLEG